MEFGTTFSRTAIDFEKWDKSGIRAEPIHESASQRITHQNCGSFSRWMIAKKRGMLKYEMENITRDKIAMKKPEWKQVGKKI
jgi:hypothetical protein